MPTIQVSGPELLKAVQQLDAKEFDVFLDQIVSTRKQIKPSTLSPKESRLIQRINQGLSAVDRDRCEFLVRKQRKRTITATEHAELLQLTEVAEFRDADRAAALVELAKLRRVPVRMLMKQMGIQAAIPRG